MFASEKIVVTGLHRSGTTWLGRVIQKTGEVAVLHEPFNMTYGIQGVPGWYPYYDPSSTARRNADIEELAATLFSGKARYQWQYPNDSFFKNCARRLVGSRAQRAYRAAVKSQSPRVMLKDPFSLLLAGFLSRRYDAKIVVVVRHPAAHLVSMRRMNWVAPLEALLGQTEFRDQFSTGIPQGNLGRLTRNDLNSYFWLAAHRYVLRLKRSFSDRVLVCRHEDLAREPGPNILSICSFLDIKKPGLAVEYASKSTSGSVVRPEVGQLHNFSRDGAALANYWRGVLSNAEIDCVREIVGPVAQEFYGDSDWSI